MSQSTDGTLELQDEQTAEQKAAELAEKVASTLLGGSMAFAFAAQKASTVKAIGQIILRELDLAELVKCKERCEALDGLTAVQKFDAFQQLPDSAKEDFCNLVFQRRKAEKERDSMRDKVRELERQWQPIATAPKDGSEILGWRWDSGVLIIRWTSPSEFLTDTELERMSEELSFKSDWFYSDLIAGGRLEGDEAPTHWMPLPSTNAINSAMLKPTSAPEHSPENRTTDP